MNGIPIDISKIGYPPAYEKDDRWIKLNNDFFDVWNTGSDEEVNRVLREIDEIEKSYLDNKDNSAKIQNEEQIDDFTLQE